ncbi:MAG: heat-inducible transcriptional repressor HrcA [Oscillospiraceae bacterium]|nr:heat-inducible transcriptional repressor HrcA [Oscillospiraceae bacterium]
MEERKIEILKLVIDEYIRTGEPVSSKAVTELLKSKVSPATVRNDMNVLEHLGYLEQPHTSSGRIPTFAGFRLYIEKIMPQTELPPEEIERLNGSIGDNPTEESIIHNAATALAEVTQCAVAITNLAPRFSLISKVEIIPTGKRLYVILLITSDGGIKNKACRLEFDLTTEQLENFENYMRKNLEGIPLETLTDEHIEKLSEALGTYITALTPLVQGLKDIGVAKPEVDIKGEKNLLTSEELDKNQVVKFIEEKDTIAKILDDTFSDLRVVFGQENDGFIIGNSSMLVSKYKKGDKVAGSLGLVGPMRLDYQKVIPYLKFYTDKITDLITEKGEE